MTERLYYKEPGLLEFDATIVATERVEDKFTTTLDKTAFYPTSGGQPHDIGQLNNFEVIDVVEEDSGVIKHITSQPVGQINDSVHGIIEHNRRQYFRQVHTAQHILSRAFINLFNLETISVHLGEEYGAVELNSASVSPEQWIETEKFSNQIISDNFAIEIIFADEKAAAQLPLRKKSERSGTLRIIRIGDLDWSACGGTHCNSTAEVGMLKVIGVDKQRAHALVKFLAGKKAVEDYNQRFAVTDQLTKGLTCSLLDLPDRYGKLSEENKELRRQIANLQKQLLPSLVKSLTKESMQAGRTRLAFSQVDDLDAKLLNQLCTEVASNINGVAALVVESRMCIAVSSNSQSDAAAIVMQLSSKFSLKGGGNKTLAQLGGLDINKLDDYKSELLAILNAN